VVGVYKNISKAERAARKYFFRTLGHREDTGESENGGYYATPDSEDTGTWDEEVYVDRHAIE
jgi:hypothetical protein